MNLATKEDLKKLGGGKGLGEDYANTALTMRSQLVAEMGKWERKCVLETTVQSEQNGRWV